MSALIRILRVALIVLALVLVTGAGAVYALSERRLSRRYPVPEPALAARADSASVARGEHLYKAITCALCHGDDGGGAVYSDAGSIGFLAGPNLTRGRGGVAPSRSDADWVRAIRYGVRPDSTSLIVMPSEVFANLSDDDLSALLGYLRQLPPVDRGLAPSHFRWLGRVFLALGRMNILVAPKTPVNVARPAVAEGATTDYGRYLADIAGCHGCHGHGLSGGAVAGPPGLPLASNLTSVGLGAWTEPMFVAAMRTGRRPDGSELHEFMPWRAFRHMNDLELSALWRYLQSVPPKATGGK